MMWFNRSTMTFGLAGLLWLSFGTAADAQLRIVTYNTLDKPMSVTDDSEFQTIFGAIAADSVNGIARPVDILTLQEQRVFNTSSSTAHDIAASLNDLHGVTTYEALVSGPGFDRLGIVYNSATVDLVSSLAVPVGTRPGLRGQFRPAGYSDPASDFYVYSAHFKAGSSDSDEDRRAAEAQTLRNNADALGPDANVIFTGDFNVQGGFEDGYQNFFDSGNARAVDPTGRSSWGGSTPELMTQSTRSGNSSDGGAGGGMDDRFDFQLVTEEVADGGGFAIITPASTGAAESSYRAFGNDGNTFNQSINSTFSNRSQSSGTINALFNFSDHLPVVADYQLPALMELSATPTAAQAFAGAAVGVIGVVNNAAPVSDNDGADTLDYAVTASGDITVAFEYDGSLEALDTPNNHLWVFETATAGAKTASVEVTSQSQGVSDRQVQASIDVFDHATASLSASTVQTSLTLDFGAVDLNENAGTVGEAFSISNFESTAGFTSALDVGTWSAVSGDTASFSFLELPGEVAAGESLLQAAALDTTTAGTFESVWEIEVSDALDLPGAQSTTLTLTLMAEVVSALLLADYDANGVVGAEDLALVLSNWGQAVADGESPGESWVNTAGVTGLNIGADELALVLSSWGDTSAVNASLGQITAATGFSEGQVLALVPEPGTFGLVAVGLLGLSRRRRAA
jgi:endonuclease/exonuclease/phosphatase family metal-dependent hydrolase